MLFHDLTAVSILAIIIIMSFIIKDCGIPISLLTNSQPWHLCCVILSISHRSNSHIAQVKNEATAVTEKL